MAVMPLAASCRPFVVSIFPIINEPPREASTAHGDAAVLEAELQNLSLGPILSVRCRGGTQPFQYQFLLLELRLSPYCLSIPEAWVLLKVINVLYVVIIKPVWGCFIPSGPGLLGPLRSSIFTPKIDSCDVFIACQMVHLERTAAPRVVLLP